jgi:single-strand DNA-binding protein
MGSVNRVILIGNLGRDPEVRSTSNGQSVANFSLACTETYKDRDGNRQEKTEWVKVVAWGNLATLAGQYLSKGRQVYVEGSLQTREYSDKDGVKRYSTEVKAVNIVFLGPKEGAAAGGGGGGSGGAPRSQGGYPRGLDMPEDGRPATAPPPDDDIDF